MQEDRLFVAYVRRPKYMFDGISIYENMLEISLGGRDTGTFSFGRIVPKHKKYISCPPFDNALEWPNYVASQLNYYLRREKISDVKFLDDVQTYEELIDIIGIDKLPEYMRMAKYTPHIKCNETALDIFLGGEFYHND